MLITVLSVYSNSDLPWVTISVLGGFTVALFMHARQTETTSRLDFLWKLQAHGQSLVIFVTLHILLYRKEQSVRLVSQTFNLFMVMKLILGRYDRKFGLSLSCTYIFDRVNFFFLSLWALFICSTWIFRQLSHGFRHQSNILRFVVQIVR